MRAPGRGASQASAGVLAPYIEAHGQSVLLDLCARSLDLFDEFIQRVRDGSGRSVEYVRTGTLEVALTDAEADRLRAATAWLHTIGVPAEWIDAGLMAGREPAVSAAARGALFIGAHGFVNVGSLVQALAQSARFAGAVFESPVEAVDIVPGKQQLTVRAGAKMYTVDHVVVAAGSWSKRVRVAGLPPLPVRPIRGQLLHLQWTHEPPPARVIWGSQCYVVPWTDGTVLVGATVEDAGFDESSTVDGVRSLTSAVEGLLPFAAQAAIKEVRVGLRPAAPDGLPIIGATAAIPRVTFATGHYRNGILLAPLTAQIVARSVLSGTVDAATAAIGPDRFYRPAVAAGEGARS
jgi:glycine oxidase